jgi:hypothetical protein
VISEYYQNQLFQNWGVKTRLSDIENCRLSGYTKKGRRQLPADSAPASSIKVGVETGHYIVNREA